MELKETIAQEVIYNLSILYKVLLVTGIFLLFASFIMYLLNSSISLESAFTSNSILKTSFTSSIFYIMTSLIFMCIRNIVRIKTRKFRKMHCRI